jgi:hypothetical protein
MDSALKFTPHPALAQLRRLGVALYLALPALGLWMLLARRRPAGAAGWLAALLAAVAYLTHAVFTALLHKEFYPERPRLALRLMAAPALAALLAFKFVQPSLCGWLGATGLVCFLGLQFALWLLFAGGTHWAAADPLAGPGECGLRWRRDGRSPWFDPDHSAAARWLTGLFFVVPGLVTTTQIVRALFVARGPAGEWDALYGATLLLLGAALTAWLALRQLVGLTADGRVFGPGKGAFE